MLDLKTFNNLSEEARKAIADSWEDYTPIDLISGKIGGKEFKQVRHSSPGPGEFVILDQLSKNSSGMTVKLRAIMVGEIIDTSQIGLGDLIEPITSYQFTENQTIFTSWSW